MPDADVHVLFSDNDGVDRDAPLHPQERRPFCAHRAVRLDDDAHRAYCRNCDREIDAFEVLHGLAHDWKRWVDARDLAERDAKAAYGRLEEILRQERNAKSRIRTLKRNPDSGL